MKPATSVPVAVAALLLLVFAAQPVTDVHAAAPPTAQAAIAGATLGDLPLRDSFAFALDMSNSPQEVSLDSALAASATAFSNGVRSWSAPGNPQWAIVITHVSARLEGVSTPYALYVDGELAFYSVSNLSEDPGLLLIRPGSDVRVEVPVFGNDLTVLNVRGYIVSAMDL